jgi:hypothetical protein
MKPTAILITALLMASLVFSGCAPTPAPAIPTATPTPGPAAAHIVDLVGQGKITFKITSGAINELGLDIRNNTGQPLQVDIPAGTYFVNKDSTSQNMVVRHPAKASLDANGHVEIQLEAACANLHLTEPTRDDTFTIQRTPASPGLTRIIDQINSVQVDYPVEQAAVWIVTDDATFDELGLLVEGSRFGTSIIQETDAVRAMQLVDAAGLSIRSRAIWGDRSQLIGNVTQPDLATWLNNLVATQAVYDSTQAIQEATALVQTATVQAYAETQTAQAITSTFTPTAPEGSQSSTSYLTPTGNELIQYASSATASSEYSNPDWSAKQAVGKPDTATCGDQSTAWASLHSGGKDWLSLTYDKAVIPTRIVIFETYHPGAISLVEVLDESGNAITVYQADPAIVDQCPNEMVIDVRDVKFPVRIVKVTIDQSNHNGWDEIDAVALFGTVK